MITQMMLVMVLATQDPNVVMLRQQIGKLNEKVAAQEVEIRRLRVLCADHGIDHGNGPTAPSDAMKPNPDRFAFLGRRLGESMNEVFADQPIQKDGTQVVDGGPKVLGDLKVQGIEWQYLNKKLVGFSLTVDEDEFAKLHDYLVIRYGNPSSKTKKDTKVPYQGSLRYTSYSVETWVFPEGNMTLNGPVYGVWGGTLSFLVLDFEQRRLDLLRTKAELAFPDK